MGEPWGSPTFHHVVSLVSVIRRGAVIRMGAIGVVAVVITTLVAVLIRWLPDSASEEMDRIAFTYWFATIICIGVFAVVTAGIVYAVWAFRAQPDDESDGPPIHGHTGLEIAWTVVPALLVIAIGIVSAVVLAQNGDAGENPLRVKVFAQQFAWRFEYPDEGGAESDELVLPLDRGVKLELESADVIHSFWIPEMGQKQDVVPGTIQRLVITPTRAGRFTLVCTELCGLGHSTMRAPARVVPAAEFAMWIEERRAAGGSNGGDGGSGQNGEDGGQNGGESADGAAVFAEAGCGGCHAFEPAGSDAEIGPALNGLTAAAAVRESIVEPNATVVEGYQPGVMPGNYGETLEPAQLDALVAYLTGEGAPE